MLKQLKKIDAILDQIIKNNPKSSKSIKFQKNILKKTKFSKFEAFKNLKIQNFEILKF